MGWRTRLGLCAMVAVLGCRRSDPAGLDPAPSLSASSAPPSVAFEPPPDLALEADDLSFAVPRGQHTQVPCTAARRIVSHAERLLAFEPRPPKDAKFAAQVTDWLDPYGHWSAGKGTQVAGALKLRAGALLAELLAYPVAGAECPVSDELGHALEADLRKLEQDFELGRAAVNLPSVEIALAAMPLATTAKGFAFELGRRYATLERLQDPTLAQALTMVTPRLFPRYDDPNAWGGVLRTAAIRAYIRLIDSHGSWAPKDEAMSIYDLDLLDMGPMVLWHDAEQSLLGAHIIDGALAPLRVGDTVLKVDDLWLASLPPEQLDEISIAALSHQEASVITVYRGGEVLKLTVHAPSELDTDALPSALQLSLIPYGKGKVAVVKIHDVYDYLGSDLGQTLAELRTQTDLAGLLLDLRDNGGGAMDGALEALAYFLPARPMFPMQSRALTTEVDLTHNVPSAEVWRGALAVLVDSGTASAAEMLAGALVAYGRAQLIGSRTFGKGCIQEYVDDETKLGVFRLTTSLYALPDGSPVQQVGLSPHIRLTLPQQNPVGREATLGAVGPAWRGPDVRTLPLPQAVPWPKADGAIGACDDKALCQALNALSRDRRIARVRPPAARD